MKINYISNNFKHLKFLTLLLTLIVLVKSSKLKNTKLSKNTEGIYLTYNDGIISMLNKGVSISIPIKYKFRAFDTKQEGWNIYVKKSDHYKYFKDLLHERKEKGEGYYYISKNQIEHYQTEKVVSENNKANLVNLKFNILRTDYVHDRNYADKIIYEYKIDIQILESNLQKIETLLDLNPLRGKGQFRFNNELVDKDFLYYSDKLSGKLEDLYFIIKKNEVKPNIFKEVLQDKSNLLKNLNKDEYSLYLLDFAYSKITNVYKESNKVMLEVEDKTKLYPKIKFNQNPLIDLTYNGVQIEPKKII